MSKSQPQYSHFRKYPAALTSSGPAVCYPMMVPRGISRVILLDWNDPVALGAPSSS
jgi:hypothetical protein